MALSSLYRHAYTLTYLIVVLVLLLLLCQPLLWDIQLPRQFWIHQLIIFIFWIGLIYVNVQYIVPRLLFRERAGWFVLALLLVVIFSLLFNWSVSYWLNLPQLMHKAMNLNGRPPLAGRFSVNPFLLLATLLVLGISTTIKVVQKWQRDTAIRQSLEQQTIKTELSFLKAQINPHFFFNTLHSIYALTHLNIESAREALHTLSRMMRYVLYETQAGTTLLSKELEFLEDYIRLMQLRLTEKVSVHFEKPTALQEVSIAPMLFLPFVENAFKHGVSAIHTSAIAIAIQQENHSLKLEVRNTLLPEKRVILEESSGIGLVNTRRRLELLYPERFELEILEKTLQNEYCIVLKLDLS